MKSTATSSCRKPFTLILTFALWLSGATTLFALDQATATASSPPTRVSRKSTPNATVSRDELFRHVMTLASDEFKGRNPAGEGGLIAAKYLVSEFKKIGLQPAGDNGKYFQKFTKYQPRGFCWSTPSGSSKKEKSSSASDKSESQEPASTKRDAESGEGADEKDEADDADEDDDIAVPPAPMSDEEIQETAKKLCDWLRQKMDQADKTEAYECRNVLALLPGSDPKLKDEVILVCAHYDHFGIQDGKLYAGADDNASGTATVLELARVFANRKDRPRRSILFAAWDAEEKGLCGSWNWAMKSTLPFENIVAVINMDMVGRLRNNQMLVLGYDSSKQLTDIIVARARRAGIGIRKVKKCARSDHWPFFRKGVPSITLCTGAHLDYHSPRDTAELIHFNGMKKIAQMAFEIVRDLANRNHRVKFSGKSMK